MNGRVGRLRHLGAGRPECAVRADASKARALLQRNVQAFDGDPSLGGSSRRSLEGRTRSLLEQLGK